MLILSKVAAVAGLRQALQPPPCPTHALVCGNFVFFVQQACAAELFSLAAMAAVDDVCGGLAWPR